jgi:hypothetical protein
MDFSEYFCSPFRNLPLRKVEPFYSLVYCFAWWSYILTIDAVIYRLKGNSLFMNRRKEFLLMIPGLSSSGSFLKRPIFPQKLVLHQSSHFIERWLGWRCRMDRPPGLLETTEPLETIGIFKERKEK